MINSIVVPLDGSTFAEQGLAVACRVARETGATLVLERSVPFYGMLRDAESAEREALHRAQACLDAYQERLLTQGFKVRTSVLPAEPVQGIMFAAELHRADMICMSTHGASGLRHVVLGSVAEAVLRRTRRPMMLTRAADVAVEADSKPFRRLLVLLDGTPFAETALSFLSGHLFGRSAEVTLLRSVPPTQVSATTILASEMMAQLLAQADAETEARRLDAEQYLASAGQHYLPEGTWHARVTVGNPTDDIRTVARDEHSELIVLATHGRHGIERLLHGSVGQSLLRHSTVPLLLLPGPYAAGADHHDVVHTEQVARTIVMR